MLRLGSRLNLPEHPRVGSPQHPQCLVAALPSGGTAWSPWQGLGQALQQEALRARTDPWHSFVPTLSSAHLTPFASAALFCFQQEGLCPSPELANTGSVIATAAQLSEPSKTSQFTGQRNSNDKQTPILATNNKTQKNALGSSFLTPISVSVAGWFQSHASAPSSCFSLSWNGDISLKPGKESTPGDLLQPWLPQGHSLAWGCSPGRGRGLRAALLSSSSPRLSLLPIRRCHHIPCTLHKLSSVFAIFAPRETLAGQGEREMEPGLPPWVSAKGQEAKGTN